MLIRNRRPYAVQIAATGQVVDGGEAVEVDDEIGSSLVEQVDAWEAADGTSRPTVDDVLADVGDDPDRARQALAVEQGSDRPRKSLVSRLEEIASREESS